jgi:sugar phosphate isomerase/epimerase
VRVGLSSYAFRWAIGTEALRPAVPLDPPALVDKAAALGAQVLQICDNAPLHGLSDRALGALAGRAAGYGLALQLGIRGTQPAHLRRSLAVAERIEARVLRVVLALESQSPAIDEVAARLRVVMPDLRAAGITLAIENHFHLSPATLVHLVAAIDDPLVGVCLDPLNSIARLAGVWETVRTLAPYAVAIHAKDAVTRRAGTGFAIVGCPLGEGLVDMAGILDALRTAGRSPRCQQCVLVECWMDRLEDEAATLAQEEAWARHGIAYLHRLVDEAGRDRAR